VFVVEMKRIKEVSPPREFNFSVWKEELNKDLLSFWKSITEDEEE